MLIKNPYSPVGVGIARFMDEVNTTELLMAQDMQMSVATLRNLMAGRFPLRYDVALRLEYVTGIEAETWCHLDAVHHLARLRAA